MLQCPHCHCSLTHDCSSSSPLTLVSSTPSSSTNSTSTSTSSPYPPTPSTSTSSTFSPSSSTSRPVLHSPSHSTPALPPITSRSQRAESNGSTGYSRTSSPGVSAPASPGAMSSVSTASHTSTPLQTALAKPILMEQTMSGAQIKDVLSGVNVRILVADDDLFTCFALEEMLVKCACVPSFAVDGEKALRYLRQAKDSVQFDVVLADISMPKLNGFELLEAIRADEDLRHIPVILTSSAGKTRASECINRGAQAYLPKPLSVQSLRVLWQHVAYRKLILDYQVRIDQLTGMQRSLAMETDRMKKQNVANAHHMRRKDVLISRFPKTRGPAPSDPWAAASGAKPTHAQFPPEPATLASAPSGLPLSMGGTGVIPEEVDALISQHRGDADEQPFFAPALQSSEQVEESEQVDAPEPEPEQPRSRYDAFVPDQLYDVLSFETESRSLAEARADSAWSELTWIGQPTVSADGMNGGMALLGRLSASDADRPARPAAVPAPVGPPAPQPKSLERQCLICETKFALQDEAAFEEHVRACANVQSLSAHLQHADFALSRFTGTTLGNILWQLSEDILQGSGLTIGSLAPDGSTFEHGIMALTSQRGERIDELLRAVIDISLVELDRDRLLRDLAQLVQLEESLHIVFHEAVSELSALLGESSEHLLRACFQPVLRNINAKLRNMAQLYAALDRASDPGRLCLSVVRPLEEQADRLMADLSVVKMISWGAYGAVLLCKHRNTGVYYAVKAMELPSNDTVGSPSSALSFLDAVALLRNERAVALLVDCPFLVKTYFSLISHRYMFLVSEYVAGGDCFSLLQANGSLSEERTRSYIAEVVLALEHMHSRGITHRDVKPDNIVVGADGHIRLADFGLSEPQAVTVRLTHACDSFPFLTGPTSGISLTPQTKEGFSKGRGTPDYAAPEVIQRQRCGPAADWWSLGAVLFELLVSYPPFGADAPEQVFRSIVQGKIQWPAVGGDRPLSEHARDLISKFLVVDPQARLGANGAAEIKEHPFFDGLDWDHLHSEAASFAPHLVGPEDTSCFDARNSTLAGQPTIRGDNLLELDMQLDDVSPEIMLAPSGTDWRVFDPLDASAGPEYSSALSVEEALWPPLLRHYGHLARQSGAFMDPPDAL